LRCVLKLKQFIPERFCLVCQGCCRFAQRYSKWSAYLLKEEKKFFKKRKIPFSLQPDRNHLKLVFYKRLFYCQFFDIAHNRCVIYPLRPLDCRLYPFLLRKKNKDLYLSIHKNCPYVEKMLLRKSFRLYLKEIKSFFKKPAVRTLLKNNPQLFMRLREEEVLDLWRLGSLS